MKLDNLTEILKHGSVSQKRAAIEELIDSSEISSAHLELLVSFIEDKESSVRDSAAIALKILPDELKTEASQLIAQYIDAHDLDTRNLSGDILQSLGSFACESLVGKINSDDYDLRKFAIDVLSLIGDRSVEEAVASRIDDSDANVRMSVVECLGHLKSVGFVDKLIEIYPRDEQMQLVIIDSLGKIGSQEAENFLVEIIKTSQDEFITLTAIEALSECAGSANTYYYLAEFLKDQDSMLQFYTLKAMSAIAFRLDIDIVYPGHLKPIALEALGEQDDDIVIAALMVLAESFSPEDIENLCTLVWQERDEINTWILYLRGSKLDLFFLEPFMDYLFERTNPRTLLRFAASLNQVVSSINQTHFEALRDLMITKAEKHTAEIIDNLKDEFLL